MDNLTRPGEEPRQGSFERMPDRGEELDVASGVPACGPFVQTLVSGLFRHCFLLPDGRLAWRDQALLPQSLPGQRLRYVVIQDDASLRSHVEVQREFPEKPLELLATLTRAWAGPKYCMPHFLAGRPDVLLLQQSVLAHSQDARDMEVLSEVTGLSVQWLPSDELWVGKLSQHCIEQFKRCMDRVNAPEEKWDGDRLEALSILLSSELCEAYAKDSSAVSSEEEMTLQGHALSRSWLADCASNTGESTREWLGGVWSAVFGGRAGLDPLPTT